MTGLWNDIRAIVRGLLHQPLFALTAILTIGLGIGINSTIFSLINSVILKPLPIEELDRFVNLYTTRPDGSGANAFSLPDFRDLEKAQSAFDGVLGYGAFLGALAGPPSEVVFGEMVSGDYFSLLGLEPVAGRLLDSRDGRVGSLPTAVISDRLWQTRFAGRSDVIGSSVLLNGRSFALVGIVAPPFSGLLARGVSIDVWVGFSQLSFLRQNIEDRGNRWLHVKARRRPETEASQAQAFVSSFGKRLEEQFPESNQGRNFLLYPTQDVVLNPEGDGPVFLIAGLLTGAVGLLLLVICANLANLFLARAFIKTRDYSIRQALGASRADLIRQPLLEALLLSLAGGAVGLGLAFWCSSFLGRFAPPLPVPIQLDLGIDFRVILFSVALSVLVALVFGLTTGAQVRRTRASLLLREGDWATAGRSQRRWSRFLLVPQLSFSVLILIVAGLFLRSVQIASEVDPGFDTTHTAMAGVQLGLAGYDEQAAADYLDRLKARVDSEADIVSSAVTSWVPAGILFGRSTTTIWSPVGGREIQNGRVGLDFFQTLQIPVLQGREFLRSDYHSGVAVAIVSQAAARAFWPGGQSALGQRLRVGGEEGPWHEVIGIARDTKVQTLGEEAEPFLYTPILSNFSSVMLVTRSRSGNNALVPLMQDVIHEFDPNVPIFDAITFQDHISILVYPFRMAAALGSFLGLATLTLVVIGLYGLVALSVSQRLRELGIRIALGARPANLVQLLLREVSWLVLGSVVLGLAGSVGISRVLAGFVFGIQAQDPLTFTLVPLLLAATQQFFCNFLLAGDSP